MAIRMKRYLESLAVSSGYPIEVTSPSIGQDAAAAVPAGENGCIGNETSAGDVACCDTIATAD